MTAGSFRKVGRAVALLVCAVLAIQVFRVGVSGLMLRGNPEGALAVWSGSAAAASQAAENLVQAGKIDEGQALAVRALAISARKPVVLALARLFAVDAWRAIAPRIAEIEV